MRFQPERDRRSAKESSEEDELLEQEGELAADREAEQDSEPSPEDIRDTTLAAREALERAEPYKDIPGDVGLEEIFKTLDALNEEMVGITRLILTPKVKRMLTMAGIAWATLTVGVGAGIQLEKADRHSRDEQQAQQFANQAEQEQLERFEEIRREREPSQEERKKIAQEEKQEEALATTIADALLHSQEFEDAVKTTQLGGIEAEIRRVVDNKLEGQEDLLSARYRLQGRTLETLKKIFPDIAASKPELALQLAELFEFSPLAVFDQMQASKRDELIPQAVKHTLANSEKAHPAGDIIFEEPRDVLPEANDYAEKLPWLAERLPQHDVERIRYDLEEKLRASQNLLKKRAMLQSERILAEDRIPKLQKAIEYLRNHHTKR